MTIASFDVPSLAALLARRSMTLDWVAFLVINDDGQALTRWEVGEPDRTEMPFRQ